MKTYDETISAIFSKGDELIEKRRERSAMIKHTSYAVSGLCAAAIVGVGIWRITDNGKMPDNHFSEIETVEEKTTNTTISEPAVSTADTETIQKTTSSKKSSVTSAATSSSAVSHTDQIHHKTETITKTTISTASQSTRHTTQNNIITSETVNIITTTQAVSNTSVSTSVLSTTATTTISMNFEVPNNELTIIFDTIELSEEDSIASDKKIQKFKY